MKERLLRLTAIIQIGLALLISCGIVLFIWFNWVLAVKVEGSFIILLSVTFAFDKLLGKYLDSGEVKEGE